MDRDELVRRNQRLLADRHRPSLKHYLRDAMLHAIAKAPVSPRTSEADRLLIIKPDHLGDVLLATPAIQAIKRKRPEISIDVLCGPWAADLLAPYDEIDQVLTLPFPGFQRSSDSASNPWKLALRSARWLRSIGYSCAIIMRHDHWWGALLAFLAGIPVRVGYNAGHVAPFLTEPCDYQHQHAVEQNLRLVETWMGALKRDDIRLNYPANEIDRDDIASRFEDWGIASNRALICIHPGSGAPSKLWSAEKWVQVAEAVATEYGAAVIFTGGATESALIDQIVSIMSHDAGHVAGPTTVGQLAALYERSLVVLGPDSGALHVAAAVDTATVALFGPADPIEFAPLGEPRRHAVVTSDMGCRPCRILDWFGDNPDFHPCVRDITVSQVLEATRRVTESLDPAG